MLGAAALGDMDAASLTSIRRRAILSCAMRSAISFELFDFTIYGYFAAAIARAFYPTGSMFSTFAYGDRMGRRAALVVTIGLMPAAIGSTGLIPNYQAIGVWAPIAQGKTPWRPSSAA